MTKRIKIVFIASVVINVLLIGVLIGSLPGGFYRSEARQSRFAAEIEKLPEPARSRLRDKIAQLRSGDSLREQLRQAHNEAVHLLVAEPFDEPAYERQLSQVNELRAQMGRRISEGLKQVVRELPREQRAAVGEALKRPPPPPA